MSAHESMPTRRPRALDHRPRKSPKWTPDPARRNAGPLPLVKGGQGRTERSVRSDAETWADLVLLGLIGLAIAVLVATWGAWGGLGS